MAALLEGRAATGHLLRRAGFGHGPGTEAFEGDLAFPDAVERLLQGLDDPAPPVPPGFDPFTPGGIQRAWLARMLSGRAPLAERLAYVWHGHFATSQAKVVDGALLWTQMETFRARGHGRFADLALAVSRDVAMVRWLDGNANRKGHPNENYARELQELFALGRGSYGESDVREVARAFTGWGSRHHDFVFDASLHDHGEKSFHGQRGPFGGEDAVRIVTSHPACAPFVCGKLLRAFSQPEPSAEEVAALVAVWRATDGDVRAVLRALLLAPSFREASRQRALVRSPVEFVVAAARLLGAAALPPAVEASMDRLGQVLFRPPSVKGWPSGSAWLTAGTLAERLRAAQALAALADPADVDARIEREFDGAVPAALARALTGTRGRERLALVLASPEFQTA